MRWRDRTPWRAPTLSNVLARMTPSSTAWPRITMTFPPLARPGARSESMTTYLKRVDDLEKIALSFPGVEKCFAVQAGRELRVIVVPEMVNDEQAFALARNIATKIEDGMQYPGQIRVTVIRETRCVEVAK